MRFSISLTISLAIDRQFHTHICNLMRSIIRHSIAVLDLEMSENSHP